MTTTKTAAPANAKKAPAKPAHRADAKKAPAKPAHRADYKADSRVKFTSRTGSVLPGRTTGKIEHKKTGAFIEVNLGDKKMPILKWARPAQLKGY